MTHDPAPAAPRLRLDLLGLPRLGEPCRDLATLPRTASHWSWQRESEWDGRRWTVHTVDGRVLAFAP